MIETYINEFASSLASGRQQNDPTTLGRSSSDCDRIVRKTGVISRPIVVDGEYTSDLAIRATQEVLEQTGTQATDYDALIVCTQTPDHLIPGVSSRIHGALGFTQDCYALDINQGCAGFIYGTRLLDAMIRSGTSRRAILLNADCYSRLIRPDDLATRVLFGDAAAASVFSSTPSGLRLRYTRCFSDGTGYEEFVARNSALRQKEHETDGIHMNGPGILTFALRVVPDAINKALEDCGLTLADIRTFAFHQANSFVIGKLAQKMALSSEQVPQNCAELGNTVSASIPILLQERKFEFRTGDLVMTVGFGVGLSWGVALFEYVAPQ
jgi:3-oxoacyl-[acyl-carrier-protein] synthase-3